MASFRHSSGDGLATITTPYFKMQVRKQGDVSIGKSGRVSVQVVLMRAVPKSTTLAIVPSTFGLSRDSQMGDRGTGFMLLWAKVHRGLPLFPQAGGSKMVFPVRCMRRAVFAVQIPYPVENGGFGIDGGKTA